MIFKLFDRVRIIKTGEIGYIVDIDRGYIVVEKETDKSDDKLIYDATQDELELCE